VQETASIRIGAISVTTVITTAKYGRDRSIGVDRQVRYQRAKGSLSGVDHC